MEFGKCIEEVSEFCTALADAELLLGFAAVWKLTSHLQRTYNVQFKGLRSTVGTLEKLQPHYSQRFDTHSLAWYYNMYWIGLSAAEFLLLFVCTPSFGSHLSVTRGPSLSPFEASNFADFDIYSLLQCNSEGWFCVLSFDALLDCYLDWETFVATSLQTRSDVGCTLRTSCQKLQMTCYFQKPKNSQLAPAPVITSARYERKEPLQNPQSWCNSSQIPAPTISIAINI